AAELEPVFCRTGCDIFYIRCTVFSFIRVVCKTQVKNPPVGADIRRAIAMASSDFEDTVAPAGSIPTSSVVANDNHAANPDCVGGLFISGIRLRKSCQHCTHYQAQQ